MSPCSWWPSTRVREAGRAWHENGTQTGHSRLRLRTAHITALAVSHAATFAATGAADGTLGLIRLSDGAVSRLTDARHSRLAPITALCFSDGPASTTRLASGASDGSYCIWRVHVGALALLPLKAVVTPAHQPGVTCLHLTRTGALALGDSAGCLRVYASETGHPDGADSSLVWEKGGDGGGAVVASVSQGRPPVPVPAQQPPVQQQHPCTMVCMAHHPGAEASQLGSWVVAAGHSSGAVAIYSVTLTGGGGGGDREHRAASRVLARGPGGGKEGCVLDASLAVGRQGCELYLVAACSDAGVHGMACAVPMPAPGVSAPRVDAQPHRGGEGEARGAVVDPLSVSESPRGELPPMPPPVPSDDEEGDERDERGGPALDEEDAVTAGPVLLATQPQRLQSGANMRAVVAQAAAMQLSRGGAKGASESDDWLLGR